jgi:hypothetical protein
MMEEIKDCPFCGAWGADMNEHDENCYLRMIQESIALGMHKIDIHENINRWVKSWNTRHVPEGYALVPIDPTDVMTFIGQSMRYESLNSIGAIYKSMIAAAQVNDND